MRVLNGYKNEKVVQKVGSESFELPCSTVLGSHISKHVLHLKMRIHAGQLLRGYQEVRQWGRLPCYTQHGAI